MRFLQVRSQSRGLPHSTLCWPAILQGLGVAAMLTLLQLSVKSKQIELSLYQSINRGDILHLITYEDHRDHEGCQAQNCEKSVHYCQYSHEDNVFLGYIIIITHTDSNSLLVCNKYLYTNLRGLLVLSILIFLKLITHYLRGSYQVRNFN